MPNIVTSIVFTGFHFIAHPPGWAIAVIIPSLVFGFFRDRYQHVLPAIILHVFYNSGYFLLFGK
jgi:membrane protease YdiL (CAAX protease family)